MKKIIALLASTVLATTTYAHGVSEALVSSCLKGKPTTRHIVTDNLDTSQVEEEDNYKDGYNAIYFFQINNKDIGYAEKNNQGHDKAIIYDGNIYKLKSASSSGDNNGIAPPEFTPSLATWSILSDIHDKYLCISFNFDGIGRSGDYQNIRGGYLLDLNSRKLIYAVRNISR